MSEAIAIAYMHATGRLKRLTKGRDWRAFTEAAAQGEEEVLRATTTI